MRKPTGNKPSKSAAGWTFLTNHSHVLVCLMVDPGATLRQVAQRIGVTERAVQKLVRDLEMAGVLARQREGRCNRYRLDLDVPLRHALEAHCSIRELLMPVVRSAPRSARGAAPRGASTALASASRASASPAARQRARATRSASI